MEFIEAERNAMRTELLPQSASEKIHSFYSNKKTIKGNVNDNLEDGKKWFDLCSDLPGCSYLSSTSDNRLYELRPSMKNVSRTLGQLLVGPSTTWNSLRDLENHWNNNILPDNAVDRRIKVSESIIKFRAPFSDTEKITREIGTISVNNSNFEIQLELEEAHGLATVKHRQKDQVESAWRGGDLYFQYLSAWEQEERLVSTSIGRNIALWLVQSVVLNDAMLQSLHKRMNSQTKVAKEGLLVQALLSARWGEERKGLKVTQAGEISATDANITDAAAALEKEYECLQFAQAFDLINYSLSGDAENSAFVAEQLAWVLSEAAVIDNLGDKVALSLASLPTEVVRQEGVQMKLKSLHDRDLVCILNSIKGWNVIHPKSVESSTKFISRWMRAAKLRLFMVCRHAGTMF